MCDDRTPPQGEPDPASETTGYQLQSQRVWTVLKPVATLAPQPAEGPSAGSPVSPRVNAAAMGAGIGYAAGAASVRIGDLLLGGATPEVDQPRTLPEATGRSDVFALGGPVDEAFGDLRFIEDEQAPGEEEELSFSEGEQPAEQRELSFTEAPALAADRHPLGGAAFEPVNGLDDALVTPHGDTFAEAASLPLIDVELPLPDALDDDEDAGLP
jgi:hypothetical protein